ncbi:hypothetical protein [Acutalibacter sp. 1XD8-33]|nr:hypothetical protein [Acutalibacter sp. 1XD8-33]
MKMVIIGYSGVGKTTLANSLGRGYNLLHVDEAVYPRRPKNPRNF